MPTDLPPCADCAHYALHLPTLGCMFSDCTCQVYVPPLPVVVASPTLERARAERDAAVKQVEAAASPEWLERAEREVRIQSQTGLPFSTDDVWENLAALKVPPPREPRAMGPVIRRALTAGTIVPAGYTQSRRRHAALIRTYTGSHA